MACGDSMDWGGSMDCMAVANNGWASATYGLRLLHGDCGNYISYDDAAAP